MLLTCLTGQLLHSQYCFQARNVDKNRDFIKNLALTFKHEIKHKSNTKQKNVRSINHKKQFAIKHLLNFLKSCCTNRGCWQPLHQQKSLLYQVVVRRKDA